MNRAFNHGSQGDLFQADEISSSATEEEVKSSAPEGTGELIREAARLGDVNALKAILENYIGDPIVNEGDTIGTTALHSAASNGHTDCVMFLLSNGANKELKNHYGQTPYAKAATPEIRELVKPVNVVAEEGSWCLVM
jgi:ankyrin repeat protein